MKDSSKKLKVRTLIEDFRIPKGTICNVINVLEHPNSKTVISVRCIDMDGDVRIRAYYLNEEVEYV